MYDKTLTCVERDCGKQFIITSGEQEFYASRIDEKTGKSFILPKRCPDCRFKRKEQKILKDYQEKNQQEVVSNSPFNQAKEQLREKYHDRKHGGR